MLGTRQPDVSRSLENRQTPRVPTEERRDPDMTGLMVFSSLAEALRCGFQVYDRTRNGYLVRIKTAAGWALALVEHPA